MAILDHIQVRILVNNEVVPEYEHPASPTEPDYKALCIRAEPGQSFIVEVNVLEGYDLQHAPFLLVKMYCDGFGKASRHKCHTERIPQDHQIVTRGGNIARYQHCRAKDDRSGQWFKYRYAFAPLETSAQGNHGAALTPKEADDLGSIRISVCRAFRIATLPRFRRGLMRREVDRVSETDLDGRTLTTSIQRIIDAPAIEPAPKEFRYIPLPGSRGVKTRFTYFYRSKRPLQALGLIPRTPSPPNPFELPSSPAGVERTRRLISRKERELAVLNKILVEQNDDYDLEMPLRPAVRAEERVVGVLEDESDNTDEEMDDVVAVKDEQDVIVISSDSE